jgi:hypothetical protein
MAGMRQCSLASLVIHGRLSQRCRVPKGVYCELWTGTLPKVGHRPKVLLAEIASEQVGAADCGEQQGGSIRSSLGDARGNDPNSASALLLSKIRSDRSRACAADDVTAMIIDGYEQSSEREPYGVDGQTSAFCPYLSNKDVVAILSFRRNRRPLRNRGFVPRTGTLRGMQGRAKARSNKFDRSHARLLLLK